MPTNGAHTGEDKPVLEGTKKIYENLPTLPNKPSATAPYNGNSGGATAKVCSHNTFMTSLPGVMYTVSLFAESVQQNQSSCDQFSIFVDT